MYGFKHGTKGNATIDPSLMFAERAAEEGLASQCHSLTHEPVLEQDLVTHYWTGAEDLA